MEVLWVSLRMPAWYQVSQKGALPSLAVPDRGVKTYVLCVQARPKPPQP